MGGAGRWRAAGGGWLRGGRGSSSVLRAPARPPVVAQGSSGSAATPEPSPPPPAAAGLRGALRLMGEGGGKLSAVCERCPVPGVTREHRVRASSGHRRAQRGRSAPGPLTRPPGRNQRPHPHRLSGSLAAARKDSADLPAA